MSVTATIESRTEPVHAENGFDTLITATHIDFNKPMYYPPTEVAPMIGYSARGTSK